jgi:glutathione peroxidase
MATKRIALHAAGLTLAGFVTLISTNARAQEPASQDKLGQGAVGHQKPNASDTGSQAAKPDATKPDSAKKPAEESADPAAKSGPGGGGRRGRGGRGADAAADGPEKTLYDYELPGPDGKSVPFSTYKGKTLLIVNLGRNSMYASQLAALEKLNEQYKDKGFVVIGVPSNEFGAAEPGTDPEIQKVYKVDDKVTFPVMAKSELTGTKELPVFTFLTGQKAVPDNTGPVHWNFTKFLIDKNGKLVARFEPDVTPDSPEMSSAVEEVIAGTFKPRVPGENNQRGGRGGGMGADMN